MLSDEEKAIEELKNKKADYFMISNLTGKTLVNLIEKQQKEIEELKNADLTTVYLNGVYDGEKKAKNKIKAKIEELDKMKSNGKYTVLFNSDNVMELVKAVNSIRKDKKE